jgi:hypothetical protein
MVEQISGLEPSKSADIAGAAATHKANATELTLNRFMVAPN